MPEVLMTSVISTVLKEAISSAAQIAKAAQTSGLEGERGAAELTDAGDRYKNALEARYNFVRIFGMESPIPLRDIYVRVNVLTEITAGRRLNVQALQADFDFDKRGFGTWRQTLEGSDLVLKGNFSVNNDVRAFIIRHTPKENHPKTMERLLRAVDVFRTHSALFKALCAITSEDFTKKYWRELSTRAVPPARNYIILGKPGAGKTTFLKYLTLLLLDRGNEINRIPFFITLRDYAESGRSLFDYLLDDLDQFSIPNCTEVIKTTLNHGAGLILLDGLDEVNEKHQATVIREIKQLSTAYPKSQFVLSCRVAAYNHWFSNFYDLEIADFNEEQIKSFVLNWFKDELPVARACLQAIQQTRQTFELASNPLLLTLLCIAYDKTLGFPKNRAELYKEAIEALLKKWDSTRRIKRDELYKQLSPMRKESLLSRVAAETFEKGRYFFPQRELQSLISKFIVNLPGTSKSVDIDSEAVLKAIEAQHGFFVERARGIYSFSHLTFQEYFTAKHVIDNHNPVSEVALIKKVIADTRWREVCLLTAGLLEQADNFLINFKKETDAIITKDPALTLLKRVDQFSSQFSIHPPTLQRCLFLLYLVNHGLACVRQPTMKPMLQKIVENLSLIASGLDEGRIRSSQASTYLTYATDLARQTNFPAVIAEKPEFCLQKALHVSPHSQRSCDFPSKDLVRYTNSSLLLVECLTSECYIDRELRKNLLDSLILIPNYPSKNRRWTKSTPTPLFWRPD